MAKFTQEQLEILLRARTGQLNDNGDKMFYDLTFNRFIHIFPDNSLEYYNKDAGKRMAYELTNYMVRGSYVIEELPNYICKFNPKVASGFYEENRRKYFNFFEEPQAFSLKKAKEHRSLKDISFVKNYKYYNILLNNLFVKEEYLEYFINWLSVIINERIKTRTAIILKGREGTGKGILQNHLIVPIFSEKYVATVENEALRSQFNGELENKLFVFFNEIKGDFRESATLYEKLKIYISDSTISINKKGDWAGNGDNYFNCMFFSNNNLPVQISPTDRRYTVFNTSNESLEQICDSMGITTDDFVEGLRKERENFIRDLFAYDYEIARACRVLKTEEKAIIAEATTPKLQLISNKLKEQNFEWLYEKSIEILETMKLDINSVVLENIIKSIEEKLPKILEEHLTKGYLTSEDLIILYRLFVNLEEASSIKISNAWTPYLGKSKLKKINGKPVRVRIVGAEKDLSIENYSKANQEEEIYKSQENIKEKEQNTNTVISSKEDNKIETANKANEKDEQIFTDEFLEELEIKAKPEDPKERQRRLSALDKFLKEPTPLDKAEEEETKKEKYTVIDYDKFKERVELTQKANYIAYLKEKAMDELREEEFDIIIDDIYGTSPKTFGDLLKEQQYA